MGADPAADRPRRSALFTPPAMRRSAAAAAGRSASKASPAAPRVSFAGDGTANDVHDIPQVDDEEEECRQREEAAQSSRRTSLPGVAGLTHTQLAANYATCVKLNAENKINVKNAFSLQLIDYMALMIRQKSSELNDFQVASYSLDASAKIYGCRVEVLHGDTMRMAGGLGRGEKPKPDQAVDEDGEPIVSKRKRKGRRGATVEQNIANLNRKTAGDLSAAPEPLLRRGPAAADDGAGAPAFLWALPARDDSLDLLLDSGEDALPTAAERDEEESPPELTPPDPEERLLCPPLTAFSFRGWSLEGDGEEEGGELGPPPVLPVPPADLRHRFDGNAIHSAIMEDPMEDDFDGGLGDDDGVGGGADSPGGDPHVTVGRAGCGPATEPATLLSMMSAVPQEYSYFNQRQLLTWAGPKHWKLPPLVTGRQAQKTGRERTRKKKVLDYDEEVDFAAAMSKGKRTLTLKPVTMKKWSCEKTTLPENLHYDVASLFKVYLMPELSVVQARTDKVADSQVDLDSSVADYDYDNQRDTADYCPSVAQGEDCDDYDQEATFLPSGPGSGGGIWDASEIMSLTTVQSTGDLIGDNLVQAPRKVERIHIAYARTAKKMDMRKLKDAMWRILTDASRDKENSVLETPVAKVALPGAMPEDRQYSFRELYHRLPALLSSKMSDNLSVALAFTALLHTANERCLSIAGANRLDDFFVSQDTP